jgi:hypothetical protein
MADNLDEAAVRAEDREERSDRARAILSEFADATLTVTEAMLDDGKQRAAQRVDAVAEGLRSAAQGFARADSQAMARYTQLAADQIEDLALQLRNRRWSEIVAEAEDLARRRPTLFMLGATVAGFLAGRLLSLPIDRQRPPPGDVEKSADLSPHRGETDEITAAVSQLTQPTRAGPEIR